MDKVWARTHPHGHTPLLAHMHRVATGETFQAEEKMFSKAGKRINRVYLQCYPDKYTIVSPKQTTENVDLYSLPISMVQILWPWQTLNTFNMELVKGIILQYFYHIVFLS